MRYRFHPHPPSSCNEHHLTRSEVYSARELEAEQNIGARYRPPALRALASGGSPPNEHPPSTNSPADTNPLPPTNYPPGFRRARAGTLPSNVQLAAQRFAAASSNLGSPAGSTESFAEQLRQRNDLTTPTVASAGPAPVRPGLRHSASVASSVASSALTERNSRLRSGSLTLPSGGLSNAFGPSIFSSSWLSSRNGGNGLPVLDDLRSVASMDDEFDVHTLDYLGLDDGVRHPPAATISELRNQAQAAITVNLNNPARMRASTVSNPYHLRPSAASLLATPNAEEEEEIYENDLYHRGGQARDSYGEADPGNYLSANYVAQGFKQSDHLGVGLATRPRAISVGTLDDSASRLHRRAGVGDLQSSFGADISLHAGLGGSGLNLAGILRSEKAVTPRNGLTASVHFPNADPPASQASAYLAAPSTNQNRAISPKSENPSTQMQTPTRSLWIGNLDSSFTSEQLIHVFAPYGAIESLRLLPEKVCSFRRAALYSNAGFLLLSLFRNAVSSTSSTRRMPSAPRMMSSTALEATSGCRTARQSVSGLVRRIVLPSLPRRVRTSTVPSRHPLAEPWARLAVRTLVFPAWMPSCSRRRLVPYGSVPSLQPQRPQPSLASLAHTALSSRLAFSRIRIVASVRALLYRG